MSERKQMAAARRDFRRDPGLPEAEVARRSHTKGKNKKHVHNYVPSSEKTLVLRYSYAERRFRHVRVYGKVCKDCGHKRRY